jgi:hypothetical protein
MLKKPPNLNGPRIETPGTWNLKDVKGEGFFSVPEKLEIIAMILICEQSVLKTDKNWLEENFKQLLLDELSQYGFCPKKFAVEGATIAGKNYKDMRSGLSASMTKAWITLNRPSLVIVQLPKKDKDLYSHVKWWGDCDEGVATVCITYQKLAKSLNEQLVGNLA